MPEKPQKRGSIDERNPDEIAKAKAKAKLLETPEALAKRHEHAPKELPIGERIAEMFSVEGVSGDAKPPREREASKAMRLAAVEFANRLADYLGHNDYARDMAIIQILSVVRKARKAPVL